MKPTQPLSASDATYCSAFRGPIEHHQGTIRVRVDVQREGTEYWARAVADPIRPESMPLASGATRDLAIHAACEKASIQPNFKMMDLDKIPSDIACLHKTCTACNGTGRKKDGTYCIHALSCPCPMCSPGSLNLDRRVTC